MLWFGVSLVLGLGLGLGFGLFDPRVTDSTLIMFSFTFTFAITCKSLRHSLFFARPRPHSDGPPGSGCQWDPTFVTRSHSTVNYFWTMDALESLVKKEEEAYPKLTTKELAR